MVVYGSLSGEACQVDPRDLIFGGKHMEGFWLSTWFATQNPLSLLWKLRPVLRMLDKELRTEVAERLTLEQAASGLERNLTNASRGKVLILPQEA